MAATMMGVLLYILVSAEPIGMGFGLAVYSVVVGVLIGDEFSSYFGYLVFFVYVGTLVVMFCIVVRLAPNPKFRFDLVVSFYSVYLGVNSLLSLLDSYGEAAEWGEGEGVFPLLLVGENVVRLGGNSFEGLGVYGGVGWGFVLVCLGLILILRVVSVVSIRKRSSGPLVRFVRCVSK